MRGAACLVLTWMALLPRAPLVAADQQAARSDVEVSLPPDVDPVSRNRLQAIKPGVHGAAAIRLHVSGVNVRWASPLGRATTELAILTTAREHDQPYDWSLHEMEAVAVGLAHATVAVVTHRRPLRGLPDTHAVIVQLGREIFGTHRLSSATYARAL